MLRVQIGGILDLVRSSHIIFFIESFELIFDIQIHSLTSKVVYLFVTEYFLI